MFALWQPAGPAAGVLAGLGICGWVTASRRTLAERARMDRWVTEVSAAIRSAADEIVALGSVVARRAERAPGTF